MHPTVNVETAVLELLDEHWVILAGAGVVVGVVRVETARSSRCVAAGVLHKDAVGVANDPPSEVVPPGVTDGGAAGGLVNLGRSGGRLTLW